MARQATRLRAQCPLPGTRLSFACAVGAAATVAPYLSTDSRGRSPEPLCDLPHRLTGRNTMRNLFAFIAPQRYPSRPVRLIVPAPAGAGYDLRARLISQVLSERLGAHRR